MFLSLSSKSAGRLARSPVDDANDTLSLASALTLPPGAMRTKYGHAALPRPVPVSGESADTFAAVRSPREVSNTTFRSVCNKTRHHFHCPYQN